MQSLDLVRIPRDRDTAPPNATPEGNNRPPSAPGMTVSSLASITAHTEFVAPESISTILVIYVLLTVALTSQKTYVSW
jgi:hypothetical protein